MAEIEAYLSLGSNSEAAPAMLERARTAINNIRGVKVAAASPVYRTEPQDYREQPWFHNQVLKIGVDPVWTAPELLRELLRAEADLGRIREGPRFGPRRIDIDLLLFGDEKIDSPACTVPHPRMARRAFALAPLLDLAPGIKIMGRPAAELLAALPWRKEGLDIYQD